MIGLTGKRHVGKSEVAKILVERHGFIRAHPFDGGKAAAKGYFIHLGATDKVAEAMINGNLKDVPSKLLPGRSTPRYFMEKLGFFMPTVMGLEWTIGAELDRHHRRDRSAELVFESIVYEAEWYRRRGGVIVRITRPGVDGPAGINTDDAQAAIVEDYEIVNDGDLEELASKVEHLLSMIRARRVPGQ